MPAALASLPTDPAAWLATALGLAGFAVYAGADIALCLRRLTSEGIAYYLLNGLAAGLIGASLLHSFNLGAFLTELLCLVTSCTAIALRVAARRRKSPPPTPVRGPDGARPMPMAPRLARGAGLCPHRID